MAGQKTAGAPIPDGWEVVETPVPDGWEVVEPKKAEAYRNIFAQRRAEQQMLQMQSRAEELTGMLDDQRLKPEHRSELYRERANLITEIRRQRAPEATSSLPAIVREPFHAAASVGANVFSTLTRPFSKELGDYFAELGQQIHTQAEATRRDDWSPWFSRMYGGATESLLQAGVAAPAGPYGVIGSFAVTEGNQALYDAEQAGLEGNERLKYAAVQGAIEGTIAAVFQRFAPGFEGLVPRIASQSMKTSGRQFLRSTAEEIPEELLTELGHALAEAEYGIDPEAMDADQIVSRGVDTVAQTVLTMGLAHASTRVTQNQNMIAELERIQEKGFVTAEEGQGLGLNSEQMRSRNTRWQAVEALKRDFVEENQELQKEIRNAEDVRGTQEQVREGEGRPDLRRGREDQEPSEPTGEEPPAREEVQPEDVTEEPTDIITTEGEVARPASLPPNSVVAEVRDNEGNLIGYETATHDGTEEGIKSASEGLRQMIDAKHPNWSNIQTRTGATNETGTPAWVVSPNSKNIAPAGTADARWILGEESQVLPAGIPVHESGIPIEDVIEFTGLPEGSPALDKVGLPREEDPLIGDIMYIPGRKSGEVIQVWRTASPTEPDGVLHTVLQQRDGTKVTYTGRDAEKLKTWRREYGEPDDVPEPPTSPPAAPQQPTTPKPSEAVPTQETQESQRAETGFTEGDRVSWVDGSGRKLTGTITTVDSESGGARIQVDQTEAAGGVPIERVARRPLSALTKLEAETGSPDIKLANSIADALDTGETLDRATLHSLAAEAYGGTRAEGAYDPSRANDALELGVNLQIARSSELEIRPPNVDATQAKNTIDALNALRESIPSQTTRSGLKETAQQFSTPPAYAYAVNWIANINNQDVVLEPSVGTGSLAVHAKRTGATVYGNELKEVEGQPNRRVELAGEIVDRMFTEDAEQIGNILSGKIEPTVVVMNPPFSTAAGRIKGKKVIGADLKHIDAALSLLVPEGRLVAIIGAGLHGKTKTLQNWEDGLRARGYDLRADVELSRDVYKGYGTTFPTRVLVIDKAKFKPMTVDVIESPGAVGTVPAPKPFTGKADNLHELIDMMEGIRNDRAVITQPEATRPEGEKPARQPRPEPSVPPPTRGVDAGERSEGPVAGTGRTTARPGDGGVRRQPVSSEAKEGTREAVPEPGDVVDDTGRERDIGDQPTDRVRPGTTVGGEPVSEPVHPERRPEPRRQLGVERVDPKERRPKELTESVFETYEPRRVRIKGAKPHPASVVESSAMSAVDPPASDYAPDLPQETVDSGALSDIQLEAISYAGNANSQMIEIEGTEYRKGFLIGDGTGIGKGRTAAGIILDNIRQGRKKAVWVTVNYKLLQDSKEYGDAVGLPGESIFPHNKIKSGVELGAGDGVLFTTYDTMRGQASAKSIAEGQARSRVDQIVEWLGEDFDGAIIFDEAHRMGNAVDSKGNRGTKKASQMALSGLELQRRLPQARITYMSATAATEVTNLAYAERLGLWGKGTPFSNQEEFNTAISAGGVAAMEKVAADMKAMGLYVSRNISFNDGTPEGTVGYRRLEHTLNASETDVYDKMAEAWGVVFSNMNDALEETGGNKDGRSTSAALSAFWGANQRFWNTMLTAIQTPAVIKAMESDLEQGKSAVIQLTNTNEAASQRALSALEEGQSLDELDTSPRGILMDFVEKSFPVWEHEEYTDESGNVRSRRVVDSEGNPVKNAAAVAMQEELLDQLGSIQIGSRGSIDMILDHFGVKEVAEVTGRTFRLEKDASGKLKKENRSKPKNLADIKAFMSGKKRILVFSQAGGTGASYHAALDAKNQQPRVHYLLQAGWRADLAIQGLGRTHRSNQAQAPEYVLVHTNLKGQKRFISTIARRLAQLGAITKGQRQAVTGGKEDAALFTAADNLESAEAKQALTNFYQDAVAGRIEGVTLDMLEERLGLKLIDKESGSLKRNLPPITQFLNRVLSLPVNEQNIVFDAFEGMLQEQVDMAMARGELDQGIETVRADHITKKSDKVVHTHESGAETRYVEVTVAQRSDPTTWEEIPKQTFRKVQFYVRSKRSGKVMAVAPTGTSEVDQHGRTLEKAQAVNPMGKTYGFVEKLQNEKFYEQLSEQEAEEAWNKAVEETPEFQTTDEHFLTGALLPIWNRIPGENTRVMRMLTDQGEMILGRQIPTEMVGTTLRALGASVDQPQLTPAQAVQVVMENNSELRLANGWSVQRRRVQGENRMEIVGPSFVHDAELEAAGVFKERIQHKTRYFIPTANAESVLDSVLQGRPITDVARRAGEGEFGRDVSGTLGIAAVPIGGVPGQTGVGKSVRHFFQRFFTSRGELPEEAYRSKVRRDGRIAKEMNQLRFVATDFRRSVRDALGGKELTQSDVEAMNSVLRGESDLSTVPQDVRGPILAMRDHIDSLSRQLIHEGVAQGELIGIIDENMGVYTTRSYRVFDDPKWRKNVPDEVRNRAFSAVRAMYPTQEEVEAVDFESMTKPEIYQLAKRWGVLRISRLRRDELIEAVQTRSMVKTDEDIVGILESLLFRGAAESPVALLRGSKLGSKDLSVFMRRKEIPQWLRELWGEYKDAGVNYARSVFKMSHLLANQQFLNEVREAGEGKWLRTQEEGPTVGEYGELITKIAADASSVMEPLNGMYTTPEIRDAFERMDAKGFEDWWMRAYFKVNYAVKYAKTVGSMMTHIRNMISNTGFAIANGHWRVGKAGTALKTMATGMLSLPNAEVREYYKRLAELGLVGENVRAGELKDALRDASEADIDTFLYNRQAREARWWVKAGRESIKALNRLYEAEDAIWKAYAFENEKDRYRKSHPEWSDQQIEEHAAGIVRDTYPTYSKIPEGVKQLRRFPGVGTFVSFPSEVVRTTFNTLKIGTEEMKAPETRAIGAQRMAGTAIAIGGLSILSAAMRAMFGIGDDEDEDLRWFVPPWQENSRFVFLAKPQGATYRFVDLGYSDPHAYLTDAVIAFMRGENWKERLGNSLVEFLRPFASEEILAKAIREVLSNEDVYNEQDEIGQQAKDIVVHMWTKALEPGTISSLRRIRTAIHGTDPNLSVRKEVLAMTTGQRLQKVDVEHSLGFRVRDFSKELTDIHRIARQTATSRGTATGEMVATDVARMERLRLASFSEMQRIIGAARRLGVPEENIRAMLIDELPDDIAEELLTGDYSEYEMTPQTVNQMMQANPEEFAERFAAWHGEETPEAVRRFAMIRIGNIPPTRPTDPDEAAAFDAKMRETRQALDALGISQEEAAQLLLDYAVSQGWKLKGDAYRNRALRLGQIYRQQP